MQPMIKLIIMVDAIVVIFCILDLPHVMHILIGLDENTALPSSEFAFLGWGFFYTFQSSLEIHGFFFFVVVDMSFSLAVFGS